MAALRQFLGELRVGQSVDERANGLGDVVGRSCRAGRHVVLLWVRPVAGCTKYATARGNRPDGRSAAVAGRNLYSEPMIETAAAGFLSVGQPAARRLALRAGRGGRAAGTLLVHGPRGSGKAAFVDDLLALSLLHRCRPRPAALQCLPRLPRCSGARPPGPADRLAGQLAGGALDRGEHRGGRASLASRRGGRPDRRRAPGDPHRACRPGQRADPERAAEGARGADRSAHLHPRRRRGGTAPAHDPIPMPGSPDRSGRP